MLCIRKKIVILNVNAAPFICKAEDNAVDNKTTTKEKKKSRKVSKTLEKDVAKLHNNKGNEVETKTKMNRKKCQ